MSTPGNDDPFFIGWAKTPASLRDLMIGIGLGLIVLLGLAGYMVAATQDDPGDGAFRGRASAIGVMQAAPYPVVHVIESEGYAPGDSVLLSGFGKRGVQDRAALVDGAVVEISGVRLLRGDIKGMQLSGGDNGLKPADGAAALPEPVDLGRWRITGEICDGKCLTGAMRPGRGLAHKACANLCLIGGVPPVFVSTAKVDGAEFFLLADADGGPVTEAILDHTAILVEVEGRVERRGTLHVFRIDPETLKAAP
ncbi:hypothetical protein AB0T83_13365 [Fluviibacterium sp. DFM31]|uniref:Uncharacterized protein n=1 Tax=Meridianimarinicoccus marinus TaxID=3231483 RepID=A0ABV3L8B7_9RHOB